MKHWILIIDSLNSILTDSIANKEIAYVCKDAAKVSKGDLLLGYIAAPISEVRMLLTATQNGDNTTVYFEKMLDVSTGAKVDEPLYKNILAVSSTENQCVELSEEEYNKLACAIFSVKPLLPIHIC